MVPVLLVWQEEIRNAVYLCSSGFFEYLTPQARGKMSVEVPYYLTVFFLDHFDRVTAYW